MEIKKFGRNERPLIDEKTQNDGSVVTPAKLFLIYEILKTI